VEPCPDRDRDLRGYLQSRISRFILSKSVHKWRCAMWTMSPIEVGIFRDDCRSPEAARL
jgi:hypothetical protein